MEKLYFIFLICICLAGCTPKCLLQEQQALKLVAEKNNPIEEYSKAIKILSACPKPNPKLLMECWYELGQYQEGSNQIQHAPNSFQQALQYAQKVDAANETNYSFACHISYLRCLIRDKMTLVSADAELEKLKKMGLRDSSKLQLLQQEAAFLYQLRGEEIGIPNPTWFHRLKGAKEKLLDEFKPKSVSKNQQTTYYYLGVLDWLLSKQDLANKAKYLKEAFLYFKKAEEDSVLKYPEMYAVVGQFYLEMEAFEDAQRIFRTGYALNMNQIPYRFNYIQSLLQPVKNQWVYNFFNDYSTDSLRIQEAEAQLKYLLISANTEKHQKYIQQSYEWIYWLNALSRQPPTQRYVADVMLGDPNNNRLNYYNALHWMHRDLPKARLAWRKSAEATGEIGAMSHFWLGYYAESQEEKLQHFDQAITLSEQQHQDALYFRGLLKLQMLKPKFWIKIDEFDKVLIINRNYFAAREKRAYIALHNAQNTSKNSLKKEWLQKASDDFDLLWTFGNDSFQLRGMIGKGFLNPESVDLSRFKLFPNHYDAWTFLESYFHLQQLESDDPKFLRYDYFNKYLDSFRLDNQVLPVIKRFVDEKKVVPRITWMYLAQRDSIPWFVDSNNVFNPIEFTVSRNDIFKSIEVYLDEKRIYNVTDSFSLYYSVPIAFDSVKVDTPSTIKIVATFKKNTKFGQKTIQTAKTFIFKKPNECDCPKKLAFIIQNNEYEHEPWKLEKTTQNESSQLEALLQSKGFTTKPYYNLDKKSFLEMLNKDYRDSILNYNVILFYYTGHGVSQEGKNYLLPKDFHNDDTLTISTEYIYRQVEHGLGQILVKGLTNKAFLYIFDACRTDTDFEPLKTVKVQGNNGLLPHSVVVYTTRQGEYTYQAAETKTDSKDALTLFMTHLPKNFVKPVDTDILQLLDIRPYLPLKTDEKPQIPEISYNLGFQLFLLKR